MKHMFECDIISGKDLRLLLCLLGAAGILALCLAVFGKEGNRVVIYVDGREQESHLLTEDGEIRVRGVGDGVNLVIIENGTVRVEDADCPDRLCVRQGRIRRAGESIICLPHRVEVVIEGEVREREADAVVY